MSTVQPSSTNAFTNDCGATGGANREPVDARSGDSDRREVLEQSWCVSRPTTRRRARQARRQREEHDLVVMGRS